MDTYLMYGKIIEISIMFNENGLHLHVLSNGEFYIRSNGEEHNFTDIFQAEKFISGVTYAKSYL